MRDQTDRRLAARIARVLAGVPRQLARAIGAALAILAPHYPRAVREPVAACVRAVRVGVRSAGARAVAARDPGRRLDELAAGAACDVDRRAPRAVGRHADDRQAPDVPDWACLACRAEEIRARGRLATGAMPNARHARARGSRHAAGRVGVERVFDRTSVERVFG